jgi:hypothetical protein
VESTVRRLLAGADDDALDQAVGRWLDDRRSRRSQRSAFATCERKSAQAVGGRASRGPAGFLESRTRIVVGVVAISTQLEPSGL